MYPPGLKSPGDCDCECLWKYYCEDQVDSWRNDAGLSMERLIRRLMLFVFMFTDRRRREAAFLLVRDAAYLVRLIHAS